jgi:hypothetical protein
VTAIGELSVMPWSHRIAEIEGRLAQILIDDRFKASAPLRELPRLAWFGVYCRRPPGAGFWDPEETKSLDAVEHSLVRLCEQFGQGWAVYVLCITTPGLREYCVYMRDSVDFSQVVPGLLAQHPDYRIEYEETADPSWKRYTSCLPA